MLLAATVVGGWSLFDLLVFTTSGSPQAGWTILPGAVAAVALGGLVGWLLGAHRAAPLVLTFLAAVATALTGLPTKYLESHHNWLVRIVFVLLVTFVVAAWVERRWRLGRVRTGLALGYLAAMGVALQRDVAWRWVWWFGASAAAIAIVVGFQRRAVWRRAITLLAVAATAAAVPVTVARIRTPARDDLPPPAARGSGPNLLLVVVDTLRADHVSCYGYGRETTPLLDSLARTCATRFTDARSTSSWTLPSHASLLTGLFPAEHGATATRGEADALTTRKGLWPCQPIDADARLLAEHLRDRGYRTGAVVGNAFNLRHQFGFGRGFEHYEDRYGSYTHGHMALCQLVGFHRALGNLSYRDAEQVCDRAIEWLDGVDSGEPYFMFVNFMDPHDPHYPDESVAGAFSDAQPVNPKHPTAAELPLLYDREVLFADGQIGRLLNELRRRGDFEHTMIVITSDHGEGLGQHGNLEHSWSLYEEVVRIPLLVKEPGQSTAGLDETPVTLVDVHDLMAAELGVPPVVRDRTVTHVAEWYRGIWEDSEEQQRREADMGQPLDRDLICWLQDGIKFIVGSNGRVEAYDLASDPGERSPLELSDERREAALERANRWWAAHPPRVVVEEDLDEETAARLRVLGYLDDEE